MELQRPEVDDARVRRGDGRQSTGATLSNLACRRRARIVIGVDRELEQDLQRELDGAALRQQLGRKVKIDVHACRQLGRRLRRIASPLDAVLLTI